MGNLFITYIVFKNKCNYLKNFSLTFGFEFLQFGKNIIGVSLWMV